MKKILTSLLVIFGLTFPANAEPTPAVGITVSAATIDSTVFDDVDSNGTKDTTKDISNDIAFGSLFFELTNEVGAGSITVGLDLIPFTAEFDSRSVTQTSRTTSTTDTSGTNKGTVDVKYHTTLYLQPGFTLPNGMTLFGTLGYSTAQVDVDVQSVSSTNKTDDETLNGVKLGAGIKADVGPGFVKLEYSETDYDDISTTTSNNTKVTADIDTEVITLSYGKSF